MRYASPIYDLLHQEIKACADHLMETCQNQHFTFDKDSRHIVERIVELHQFSKKIRENNHYHPLSDLKHYLENTMISFQDVQKKTQSMRLSEAVDILYQSWSQMETAIYRSLQVNCIHHLIEEIRPGRPLFKKLRDIKML